MSVKIIIEELHRLYGLHEQLLKLSKNKTEMLKSNEIDALSEVLNLEQKYIQAISQLEEKRIEATVQFLQSDQSPTITACIEKAEGTDQEELISLYEKLNDIMVELKDVNELNKQLIQQSLQFISLTFELVNPNKENMNYGQNGLESSEPKQQRALFDSKA
ncbi:flagellar protein FlgN [Bacillus safensis]|uniref:flagellar protein FlgN n=1 Tax=Bacillus safensis TaxID=561879 RepID=UPI00227DA38B|nr:flagellar protein FlgN [Bacillus safensis]MCY7675370.1 flagellar protein FlgN [Bacillus safensis]MCY7697131.1 flagellar protein FlgN [Bacillus safensis]MEC3625712.1 flagellar protein FlgN [Bacillus safensis]